MLCVAVHGQNVPYLVSRSEITGHKDGLQAMMEELRSAGASRMSVAAGGAGHPAPDSSTPRRHTHRDIVARVKFYEAL